MRHVMLPQHRLQIKKNWEMFIKLARNATLPIDVNRIGNERDLIESPIHRVGVPALHCEAIFTGIAQLDRAIRRSFAAKVAEIRYDTVRLNPFCFQTRASPRIDSRLDVIPAMRVFPHG